MYLIFLKLNLQKFSQIDFDNQNRDITSKREKTNSVTFLHAFSARLICAINA